MANLLEKASIVLTPTGYSRDAIHNVKPSESPFGDMTFIQNGTTTRVNENGLVVDNTTDIPRIDYSKGEGSILSEVAILAICRAQSSTYCKSAAIPLPAP